MKTIISVKVPRHTFAGFGMDENMATEGGNGCCVVIEATIEILPGGFSRVNGGLPEKIESEFGLGKEWISMVSGEILVDACKNGEEVILESSNCMLGGFAVMYVRRHELIGHFPLFFNKKFVIS